MSNPTSASTSAAAFAAAWQPQRPGRRPTSDVRDPIVEPDWGGARVVAALTTSAASLHRDGDRLVVPADLVTALVAAFTGMEAVVEGHLTQKALEDGTGAMPAMPKVERAPIFIPRGIFGRGSKVKDEPFVHARDQQAREDARLPEVLDAMRDGDTHAFVATDLLYLDGTPLLDVPLLERKRLLDGLLVPSELVRITPFVKPASARRTMMTWGQQGFAELFWRAANSRYTPGAENPEWAVARPPGENAPPAGHLAGV